MTDVASTSPRRIGFDPHQPPDDRIVAAGALVVRSPNSAPKVLLVHRPKYDDWSFPKGKVDPGEHVTAAAVREVAEETGVPIRLGLPLPKQTYIVANGRNRPKDVHYWIARVTGGQPPAFSPNSEVDEIAWVSPAKALKLLTYPHDRETLSHIAPICGKTRTLLVLRHAKAEARGPWSGPDHKRPLTEGGQAQATALAPILAAYGARRLVSSPSRRCWSTVTPYAQTAGRSVFSEPALSEEDATPAGVRGVLSDLMERGAPALVCTHRPVLPLVWKALGTADHKLEPGELAVVHHRDGTPIGLEFHTAPLLG